MRSDRLTAFRGNMRKVLWRTLGVLIAIMAVIGVLIVFAPGSVLRLALQHWQGGGFPSLSAAIGSTCGVSWTGAAGEANLTSGELAHPATLYGIGSITKTFVAVVALQLADEGKLDLGKPATHYVPELQDMDIANAAAATLAQLMNHTSGIPSWEDEPRWIRDARGADVDPRRRWRPIDTLDYIRGKPTLGPPGSAYHYSNTNYTLLGLVIEQVTGRTLVIEIEQRILQRLGLRDTFLEGYQAIPPGRAARRYHFATEQFRNAAGVSPLFTQVRPGLIDVSSSTLAPEWAAGGLLSTAHDLATFGVALRDGRLLTPKQMSFMQAWRPAEVGSEVGHGLFRFSRGNGLHTIGHNGAVLGFGAQMEWIDGGDAVIVSLSNVGTIHAGDVPLDTKAALPFVLTAIARLTTAKAVGCPGSGME